MGVAIRCRRIDLELSRKALVDRAGVPLHIVHNWEMNGLPATIDAPRLMALATALKREPAWLVRKRQSEAVLTIRT